MSLIYNDRLGASRFPQEYLQCLKALSLRQSSALAIMSGQKDAQKDTNDGHCCCWLLVVGCWLLGTIERIKHGVALLRACWILYKKGA